jgi:hypothetical protein
MNSCSAIFRAFTKDRETAIDHKINAIEKQLSVITKLHAKDMKEMKALIESVSKASVENLKVDSSIKEEINEIKEEDKKELAFMIANVEKELKDAREKLEKLKPTPKLGAENVDPYSEDEPLPLDGVADVKFDRPVDALKVQGEQAPSPEKIIVTGQAGDTQWDATSPIPIYPQTETPFDVTGQAGDTQFDTVQGQAIPIQPAIQK